jgi:hypothetical protein
MFFSFFCFFPNEPGVAFPNKKPAIVLAIAGFSEIYCYFLENSTHDAKRRGVAVPEGHASLDQRALCFNRVCHFLTLLMRRYFWVIVKEISIPFVYKAVYVSAANAAK